MAKWLVEAEAHPGGLVYSRPCRTTKGAYKALEEVQAYCCAPRGATLELRAVDSRGRSFTLGGLRQMLAGPKGSDL